MFLDSNKGSPFSHTSAIVAILNLVVVTVMGAVLAGIYNLAVKVTGGLLVGFTSN